MEEKLTAARLALSGFLACAAGLLGWKGVLVLLLALCMALDYVSGTLAARRAGTWSSKAAREGLFHKGGIVLVSTGALVADLMFMAAIPVLPVFGGLENPGAFLPLVLVWYVLTELGSVLENAVRLGAPVPKWFRKAIRAAGEAVERAAEEKAPAGAVCRNVKNDPPVGADAPGGPPEDMREREKCCTRRGGNLPPASPDGKEAPHDGT